MLFRRPLDDPQHVPLASGYEENGLAAASRTAGAPDTVYVCLRVVWNVVIHDVRDAFHVEPARGYVGGDDNVHLPLLQSLDGSLALLLRNVAVQCSRLEAASLECVRNLCGRNLGAHENQYSVETRNL